MEIEQIKIIDLIPYENNARVHSEEQIKLLSESIENFGFNSPVLCDQNNGIIAGHGRCLAAQKAGLDTVPVVRLNHLTEEQKKAFILADNRLSDLSTFDAFTLEKELKEIGISIPGMDDDFLDEMGINLDEDPFDFFKPNKPASMNPKTDNTVKMAIFCKDIEVVEDALISTGLQNRGEALKLICESYLEKR